MFGGSRMPKEQACSSGEHSLCASSSKNAKDKSNSSTLLAMRNTKDADESSGRGSRCSSEKDSGYSDGSDWQQTDVEDQQSNKNQSRGGERAETSGQSHELVQGNPGNPPLMASGHQLSPIYIINNMVLQQPDSIQKRGQLPHKNGSRESGGSGAPHMILYQQPSLLLATLQLHKPPSPKSGTTGKKKNGTYLPILNSYPRIAPHPSKKPPDKSPASDDSQNLSKRVCTEHQSDDSPVTLPDQHLNKQPKLAVSSSELPTRDNASPSSSSAVSSSSTSGSSVVSNRGSHRSGGSGSNTRHRRFLNTVEILRQSGLLDITLRTKELLRQSNATERDIAQLRQHTELLCQVANGPNGTAAWEQLHRSMAESSSYPDLKTLPTASHHPGSDSGAESVSTGDTENSDVPSSRFLTTDPKPSCPVSLTRSEKVTFMPPDSSTG